MRAKGRQRRLSRAASARGVASLRRVRLAGMFGGDPRPAAHVRGGRRGTRIVAQGRCRTRCAFDEWFSRGNLRRSVGLAVAQGIRSCIGSRQTPSSQVPLPHMSWKSRCSWNNIPCDFCVAEAGCGIGRRTWVCCGGLARSPQRHVGLSATRVGSSGAANPSHAGVNDRTSHWFHRAGRQPPLATFPSRST
jgi:hypothetical protein